MAEVKKAFNPEFLNRLDEVILFTSLTDEDLLKIIDLLVEQINVNLVAKQIKIRVNDGRRQVHPRKDLRGPQLRRASAAPRAAEVHRGSAVGSLIQGTLPRPSELEVYLGDTGIFCRPVAGEPAGELQRTAGRRSAEEGPVCRLRLRGISLYPF